MYVVSHVFFLFEVNASTKKKSPLCNQQKKNTRPYNKITHTDDFFVLECFPILILQLHNLTTKKNYTNLPKKVTCRYRKKKKEIYCLRQVHLAENLSQAMHTQTG